RSSDLSALIVLMGIVIGPWGSMGPGTLLGAELAGHTLGALGVAPAVVNIPAVVISGVVTAFIAAKAAKVRRAWRLGYLGVGAISGLTLALLVLGTNLVLGTPVAGAVASAVMSF